MSGSVRLYAVENMAPGALEVPEGVNGFNGLYEGLTLGVYEAFRTYHHDRFLDLDEHMARLARSMVRLGLNHRFDEARMRAAIQQVCSDAPFAEMRVRLDILAAPARTRGSDSRELVALVEFQPPPRELYTRGVQVVTTSAISRADPLAKSADFVEQRRRIERGTPDAYERLITEPSGTILEGFSSNFYVVREGELITAGDGVLQGVTRRIVLAQAAELGIRVRLQAPRQADLEHIQEAAISSSSRGLVPVVRIDDRPVGDGEPGPVITALVAAYETHVARSSIPAA